MRKWNIVKHRRWFFSLSTFISIVGLIVFLTKGFHLGADFLSGSRIQMQGTLAMHQLIHMFHEVGVVVSPNEVTYGGTSTNRLTMVRLPEVLTQKQAIAMTHQWPKTQIDTIDPFAAQITSHQAIWAVGLATIFIMAYVAIRFEYRFAVSSIVALLHDFFIASPLWLTWRGRELLRGGT